MPRKNNDNNPLQIRLRVESLPKSVKPKAYFRRLIQFITEGRELPPAWDVRVMWRNPKTKHYGYNRSWKWQEGDFETVVSDSREGFNALLHDALLRRYRRLV